LANRSQPVSGNQPVSAVKAAPASTVGQSSQPVSGDKTSGSDTITVIWGPDVNRVRLDEVTFENSGGGFYVRQKSNGKLVGYVDQANAEKIRAYLRGN
jgi:hypothetical protein